MKFKFFILVLFFFSANLHADVPPITKKHASELNAQFEDLLKKHKINTIGVSVIKSGKVAWINYFGEQSPGVPASNRTLFNVGSITKTITTETILQLVEKQKLELDEPMSNYWVDPDLIGDTRHNKLTPRMVLTHSTGFPNWRYFTSNSKLQFINEPGTTYKYSGEGFKYLAKFAEKRLGVAFEELVKTYVFAPAKMNHTSISVRKENFPFIANARDENGKFYGHNCTPEGWCTEEGDVSAAGGMVITVEDYSKFLIWSMQEQRLNTQLTKDKNTILIDQRIFKGFQCEKIPTAICPSRQGYGLGWNITEYTDGWLIGHGGSNWSLITLAYYYPDSKDGVVIFLNAPNKLATAAMIDAITLLDPSSPKLHEYRFRLDRMK
jgi:CubicO group peptidase (beta-lactamase class C family)